VTFKNVGHCKQLAIVWLSVTTMKCHWQVFWNDAGRLKMICSKTLKSSLWLPVMVNCRNIISPVMHRIASIVAKVCKMGHQIKGSQCSLTCLRWERPPSRTKWSHVRISIGGPMLCVASRGLSSQVRRHASTSFWKREPAAPLNHGCLLMRVKKVDWLATLAKA
jgi:hypothetical protein